jgi:hypothetical protein
LAMKQTVDLLGGAGNDRQAWPDFAQFDCAMCHHELQTPSWRQARETVGRPGRPQLIQWPEALIAAGIAGATQGDESAAASLSRELQQRLTRLHASFTRQPFGDPAQIGDARDPATASGELAEWLDELAKRIDHQGCDRPAALAALRQLCEQSLASTPDYDSARQTAWAIRIITGDLRPPLAAEGEVRAALTALDEDLHLQTSPSQSATTISEDDRRWYDAVDAYDPARFREQIEVLSRAIEAASSEP